MKTFVYHDGALGDVLLSLPCLHILRAASERVCLAGKAEIARFLEQTGIVDSGISSDQALFVSLYSGADARIQAFLAGFDRAIVFSALDRPEPAAAIRDLVADTSIIRTVPPDGTGIHVAQYRFSQLEPEFLAPERDAAVVLSGARKEEAWSRLRNSGWKPGQPIIGVHPGSGGKSKCWPLDRYLGLTDRIRSETNWFVLVFTGDAEDENAIAAVRVYAGSHENVLHAASPNLESAASLLSTCSLYIGNDSGFSHLAGALGCASLVLFGPTDPVRWKPVGHRVNLLSVFPGSMAGITIQDVWVRIRQLFKEPN